MIRYALTCPGKHCFEAWFSDSASFDEQNARNLIECPSCGSVAISKQIMAPAIAGSHRHEESTSSQSDQTMSRLIASVRQYIQNNYSYIGRDFAAKATAMHDGKIEPKPVWGETTPEQARQLDKAGVPICPVLEPFVPTRYPDKLN